MKETDMGWKPNHHAAANGITAKELAAAMKDGTRTGGGTAQQAKRSAAKAHKSAVAGGAKKK
jgi:hypothetical protein